MQHAVKDILEVLEHYSQGAYLGAYVNVLQFQEETVEVIQLSPLERFSERIIEVDGVHALSSTLLDAAVAFPGWRR